MSFSNRKPAAFDRQLAYFDNLLAARRSVDGHVRISRPLVSGHQWSKFFHFGSPADDGRKGGDDTTVELSLDRRRPMLFAECEIII